MCQIMENSIKEEKIELAKNAIKKGKMTPEEIAEVLELPVAFVAELAKTYAETVLFEDLRLTPSIRRSSRARPCRISALSSGNMLRRPQRQKS